MKRRNNAAVMYIANETIKFGLVKFFILLALNESVAVIQNIECKKAYNRICFILSVDLIESYSVVSFRDIKKNCMFLQIPNSKCYICRFPNRLEGD